MKKSVSIIGGGPASLFLALFLDPEQFDITIFERNKSLGRKFLVAGKGGFNLTHSEEIISFIERYTPSDFLREALQNFTNEDLRKYLEEIGIPTIIGSSRRVYPESGIKPIEVLNALENKLDELNVIIQFNSQWTGWNDDGSLSFSNKDGLKSDIVVFALGGSSWKVTGSDGSWLQEFNAKGITTKSFKASNCAYKVDWKSNFLGKHEGNPLKNIALRCDQKTQKGELVITKFGLEGNAIYALSPQIRKSLELEKSCALYLDLKPSLSNKKVLKTIQSSAHSKISDTLRKELNIQGVHLDLLKSGLSREEFLDTEFLARSIKNLPIEVIGFAPIDQAISTVGGVTLSAVNSNFELKQLPGHYCIGEMLDWDAPTGGYLLQACFSMGVLLAKKLNP